MRKPTDANLVFRALIILGLVLFATYLVAERGLLSTALQSDRSYISYVILGAYAVASAHWLFLAYTLGQERSAFSALQERMRDEEPDFRDLERGLLGDFLSEWQTKGTQSHPEALVTAFGDRLLNRHAFGHFASDALLKLGLLGTIVGFILMLLPVGQLSEIDAALMRQLLTAMSSGMAVALYTTLTGLVTSTLLEFQYHVLDASAADLATRLSVLADSHRSHDAS